MTLYAAEHTTVVRSATEDDLDRVLLIEELSFGATWTRHCLKTALSDDIFIVYQQKRVVGYLIACLCDRGIKAEILRIAVHPNQRGEGVGKALLETTLRILSEGDVEEVSLDVLSANRNATKLYEKVGFKIAKVAPFLGDQDFEIFYVMKLNLLERKEKETRAGEGPGSRKQTLSSRSQPNP